MKKPKKTNTKRSSNNAGAYLASPKAKAAWAKDKKIWEEGVLRAVNSIK